MVPGQERYAICLIAPAVLLVARGAAVWQAKAGRLKMPAAVLACVLAWLALADFRQHYFAFIEQTGGRAHPTFRTAAIEPKLAAFNYVLHRRAAGVAWIAADSWWSYYPLKYFALGDPNVRDCDLQGSGLGARVCAGCEGRPRVGRRILRPDRGARAAGPGVSAAWGGRADSRLRRSARVVGLSPVAREAVGSPPRFLSADRRFVDRRTRARTFSTGVCGSTPWPRLKMCPARPPAWASTSAARRRTSSGVVNSTIGSRFPCTARS